MHIGGGATSDLIQRIRDYTVAHEELLRAHHFTFDLPLTPHTHPTCLVMGINPGEVAEDFSFHPGPTEETRDFDFHALVRPSRGARRWRSTVRRMCGEQTTITEAFFWSSPTVASMRERFGSTLGHSHHLDFCTATNKALLDRFMPRCVVCPGLGMEKLLTRHYRLEKQETVRCDEGKHRLVLVCSDGDRPWLLTKHWTGSRGFSAHQREVVKEAIRKHAG